MSDIAIRVDGLSKHYQIGARQEPYYTLRETVTETLARPFQQLWRFFSPNGADSPTPETSSIWALRDVSFEVKQGEVIGIIGRNGAGKSTLLKILSRITEPTEGRAKIHGRVGSLLEVGTGFHPELTGRENIYLNGAILGMKKAEIDWKFDEIVDFAEVDQFIDTPVKHYSSGMYLRLAFAVAAHLEPEILIVDEVLAVGDAAFQKKCLGKMGDVAKEGRTVLFVSHNMGAITQLCPVSMLLRAGRLETIDRSESVVSRYLSESCPETPDVSLDPESNPKSPLVLTRCWVADEAGATVGSVDVTKDIQIGLEFLCRRNVTGVDIGIRIHNALGQPLFTSNLSSALKSLAEFHPREYVFMVLIPCYFLAPDTYSIHVGAHRPNVEVLDFHDSVLTFRVEESGSEMWQFHGKGYGNILVHFPWQEVAAR